MTWWPDTPPLSPVSPEEPRKETSSLVTANGEVTPAEHAQAALTRAVRYAETADAPNTLRAYRSDWQAFVVWCQDAGLAPLPAAPETVGAYLAAHADTHAAATLRRRLVTIARAHKQAGIAAFWPGHPAIRNVLRGIAREHGTAQRQAAALTTPEIRRLIAVCGDDLAGLRDRALILLGYAAALRRSELVGVDREHLVFDAQGVRLMIPRSKGDQEGKGEAVGVPRGKRRETCPQRALEAWLQASDTRYGPVFRWVTRWGTVEPRRLSAGGVLLILRRRAELAGIDGAGERISPHSLRAGFVTEAYRAGLRDEQIMQHTRHRDLASMRRYVRRARLLEDSPASALGL